MTSLLVTNDFPPKIGGIQSYLWELWRRLPAAEWQIHGDGLVGRQRARDVDVGSCPASCGTCDADDAPRERRPGGLWHG